MEGSPVARGLVVKEGEVATVKQTLSRDIGMGCVGKNVPGRGNNTGEALSRG